MAEVLVIATAAFGLEAVVARELRGLGYNRLKVENGQVTFAGDEKAICRANLHLHTADRVKLRAGEFQAETFDELFEGTRALPWPELLPRNASFPVTGKSVKSRLASVPDCQAIVKKAIVESMKQKYHQEWFPEDGPRYKIQVALHKDVATLTLDTSGAGLHKRGYRKIVGRASLKETLAAALVLLSRWNHGITLVDPLCGTGTIPIEAALIGLNVAPGINRRFAAEEWPNLPKSFWKEARQEAYDLADMDRSLDIQGYDIRDDVLSLARESARKAAVGEKIHFQRRPVSELSSNRKYGKIICNPPYGERIGGKKEVEQLYREMGRVFAGLETWSHYVLTSHPGFERLFGRKATKKRKLYNGNIRVTYYQFYGPKPG